MFSHDRSEISVPLTVTIPAGASSVSFDVDAVDDTVFDGTQRVDIAAFASGFLSATTFFDVTDAADLLLVLNDPNSDGRIDEGETITGFVRRGAGNTTGNVTVTIAVSDSVTGAVVDGIASTTVTILDTQTDLNTFNLTGVLDGIADGIVEVTISATAASLSPSTASIAVIDIDMPTLTLFIPPVIVNEAYTSDRGTPATYGRIFRDGDLSNAVTVDISVTPANQVTLPPAQRVTIPVGRAFADFPIGSLNDILIEPTDDDPVTVTFDVSATGYNPDTGVLRIGDNENDWVLSSSRPVVVEDAGGVETNFSIFTAARLPPRQ